MDALREFTTTIGNPYDLHELLHRLTSHAINLTNSQGAGVMLEGHNGLAFASASDEQVAEIEIVQDRTHAGPCQDAFVHNEPRLVADLLETDAWSEYRGRALDLGFRSVLGLPMNAAGQTIGVLNVYRKSAGAWSQGDVETVEVLASMAAAYVLHANQIGAQHDLAEQLQQALESRDIIGQAKGILMARHRIGAHEAFELLRTYSQDTNTKLRDIASRLVSSTSTEPPH